MKGQPYSLSCTDKFFIVFKAHNCASTRAVFQLKPQSDGNK